MPDIFPFRTSISRSVLLAAGALFLTNFQPVSTPAMAAETGAPQPNAEPGALPSYARLTDFVISADAIAIVKIHHLVALANERAPGLKQGQTRFYVSADTIKLIRGQNVLASRIGFLIDLPSDKKAPHDLKKQTVMIFGKIGQRVDQFQLSSNGAMLPWSPMLESRTRTILTALLSPDAPPAVTGISSAFHVAGTIDGEGETQIFLNTTKDQPISLSIVRRPHQTPQFSASLGEIIDQSDTLPHRDTLLWYRLACALPPRLPAKAVSDQAPQNAAQAGQDYLAFLKALGPCDR